jgi:N-acetyl-alpha-D-muramate 1-phosphate uridylyltransferase
VQLIHRRLLADMPDGAFSMNRAWDGALAAGRLKAVVHDGIWFHLSTPNDLLEAEHILEAQFTGDTRWPWR